MESQESLLDSGAAAPSERPPLFIRLSLPTGLEEYLEGLAREVLRSQPKNIHHFAAEHFERQLRKRNIALSKKHLLSTEDVNIPQSVAPSTEVDSSRNTNFKSEKGFPADKDLSLFYAPEGGRPEQRLREDCKAPEDGTELESISGRASILEGSEGGGSEADGDEEAEAAATKIQAGFRGSKARKDVKELKKRTKNTDEGNATKTPTEEQTSEKKAIEIQMPVQSMGGDDEEVSGDEIEEEPSERKEGEDEAEIDIDLEDPEVEAATTKIQAGYKGMKARKELRERQDRTKEEEADNVDIDLNDPEVEVAATKIQAGFRGHQTRKDLELRKEIMDDRQQVPKDLDELNRTVEDDIVDLDLSDPDKDQAATTIQAGYRGAKTRDEVKNRVMNENDKGDLGAGEKMELEKEDTEDIDIDLQDPEVEAAATKIQAGFRGHMARKDLNNGEQSDKALGNLATDLGDPKVDEAATRIQAGFKGHKARSEVKRMKEKQSTVRDELDDTSEKEFDFDLADPEVELAATKIQAGYKGHRARKELQEKSDNVNTTDEVDIDLNDPEVEKAATKIQAGFKGHKTRKNNREKASKAEIAEEDIKEDLIDIDLEDPDVEKAATKIQAGFKGHKARKELKSTKEDVGNTDEGGDKIDIDLDDPEVEKAATKIQAGFKGHKTRQELKQSSQKDKTVPEESDAVGKVEDKDEEIDIDLNDPEVEAAATKIQSGFKGHKARKELRETKDQKSKEEEIDIDLEDPEVEAAATKIQAGFRGHQERKKASEVKEASVAVAEAGQRAEEAIDIDLDDPEIEDAATKIQAGYRGMKVRRKTKDGTTREDKEAVIDPDDPEVQHAATQIQAGYRGMKARRHVKEKQRGIKDEATDIDLTDPDVEIAATKIQAGYKGHQARKELREREHEQVDESIDIDLNDPEVEQAATLIQAGFKGHKARREVSSLKAKQQLDALKSDEDPESLTIISEIRPAYHQKEAQEKVDDRGAIPFDMHPSSKEDNGDDNKDDDVELDQEGQGLGSAATTEGLVLSDSISGEAKAGANEDLGSSLHKGDEGTTSSPIKIYHYRGSYNSQKVMLYLYERDVVNFTAYHIDLAADEHLKSWFLALNPRAEVPAGVVDGKVVSDSTRIVHTLEARVPVDNHRPMVPCTSDTKLYQKHVYFTALIDQLPINELTHGLSFHPHFALCRPAPPYDDPGHLGHMRQVLESRSTKLRQAAEDASDDKASAGAVEILRQKAKEHEEQILPMLRDQLHYESLLERTANALDKLQEPLVENTWLLGETFGAVDSSLAVALNRLAQLGLQHLWLDCEGPRPRIEAFLKAAQSRPAFIKAVHQLGIADGRSHPIKEAALAVQDVAGAREAEATPLSVVSEMRAELAKASSDSVEVWNELEKGITKEVLP